MHSPAFGAITGNVVRGMQLGVTSIGTSAPTANQLRLFKVHFEKARTLQTLGIRVTTASAAGTLARLGIYEMSDNGLPTTLLLDAGTVLTDSLGYKEIAISQAVAKRPYYLAIIQNAAPTLASASGVYPVLGINSSTGVAIAYLQRALTFGALPADETGQAGVYTGQTSTFPVILWS